jgi:hypothetical protein
MDFEIKFHVKNEFIHCIVLGFDGSDNTFQIWLEIAKKMREFNKSKVLLNSFLKGKLDDDYRKQLHDIFSEIGIKRNDQIAVVNLNSETMEDFRKGEKILKEHGYNLSLFDNQEAAITWLLNY